MQGRPSGTARLEVGAFSGKTLVKNVGVSESRRGEGLGGSVCSLDGGPLQGLAWARLEVKPDLESEQTSFFTGRAKEINSEEPTNAKASWEPRGRSGRVWNSDEPERTSNRIKADRMSEKTKLSENSRRAPGFFEGKWDSLSSISWEGKR